jgi:uncharacterized protein involved in exopolysaccharide biosynthesis
MALAVCAQDWPDVAAMVVAALLVGACVGGVLVWLAVGRS